MIRYAEKSRVVRGKSVDASELDYFCSDIVPLPQVLTDRMALDRGFQQILIILQTWEYMA